MTTRRSVVDYALQRRAVLSAVYSGRTSPMEVCDAHPYLQRAAKFHGEQTDAPCPICRKENLTNVHYIYGDELGHAAGQAKKATELTTLASRLGEFNVYVVEVCQTCGWNHLTVSFVLGAGAPAEGTPRGRRAAQK